MPIIVKYYFYSRSSVVNLSKVNINIKNFEKQLLLTPEKLFDPQGNLE